MPRKCKICQLDQQLIQSIDECHVMGLKKVQIMAKFPKLKGLYYNLDRHLKNHVDEEEVMKRLVENELGDDITNTNVLTLKGAARKTPEELAQDAYYEQYKVQPIEPDEEWRSPVTGKVPRVKEAYDYASMAPRLLK